MTAAWLASKIEQWPIDRLVPYAKNARVHSDEQVAQIAASIVEFGWTNPVLAGADGAVVAGHGRLAAAKKLGLEVIPVIVLDHLSPTQRRALLLSDNQLSDNSAWDDALLRGELQALQADGFNLEITGFDPDELADLLADGAATEGHTDDDAVPAVADDQAAAISRPGDVWHLGVHRLLCGDCTEPQAVLRLMAGGQADLLNTDPPYGVAYSGCGRNTSQEIRNDRLAGDDLLRFLLQAFAGAEQVLRPGAACYVWHADGHHGTRPIFERAFVETGWYFSTTIIWAKNQASMGWQDYRQQHEPCLYGWKTGPRRAVEDRTQTMLWQVKRDASSTYVHPTQKPVELAERAIRNSTVPGAVVLDLFGGSGSTLIAAEKTGRRARLMELDPKYADVVVRRWQDWTGKQAIREADGVVFDDLALEVAGP